MRSVLQNGSFKLEILGKDYSVLEFRDPTLALNWLRRLKLDSAQLTNLRSLFAPHSSDVHRLDTGEFLKWLANLFVNQQLKILRSSGFMDGGNGAEEVVEEKAGQAEKSTPQGVPGKKSWIEIHLRDTEGHPMPRERYRIKLPDGSVEEGNLDAFGYAEYYGINPGSCEVSFPGLDAGEWERA